MNTTKKTIGEIVAEDFRAAAIFESFGIDFCCKGNRTIDQACDKKDLNPEAVNEALGKLKNESKGNMPDFASWPIDLLADYIEKKHHRYINETTPVLLQFLEKLCRVHGQRHPELLDIFGHFDESSAELAVHMKKEELILFPFARRLMKMDSAMGSMKLHSAIEPVSVMMNEHESEGERFRKIAELSNNYTPPADGCTTYRVAFEMLKEFQDDLHMHIHLENNILFPQILQMEKTKRMNKPIKRHESLQPLSRDHHLALLLCWKITKGLSKEIDPVRIKKYADWFYLNHLVPHFELEEKHIFPILGNDHELVTRAINEHRLLESLFKNSVDAKVSLREIESALEQHVRFEERILFNAIQDVATPEQMKMIQQVHYEENFCENEEDPFWL